MEPNTGCWLWMGPVAHNGYGVVSPNKPYLSAHRAAYELFVGPIPDGLTIDHLCRVKCCANPAHMEPVTRGENTKRAVPFSDHGEFNRTKAHCKQGHPFDEQNTITRTRKSGGRICKTCLRASAKANYKRKQLAA